MEYEKDCSLTDEVVPVDFTICMNEQAVISVSEYTRLKCKSREYNVGNGKNMCTFDLVHTSAGMVDIGIGTSEPFARWIADSFTVNGYLHCSICGKAYSRNVNHSNGHKYLQYRKSCGCDGKSVRADHLNDFVFYALQQCIFSPENKEKLLHKIHEKLAIQRHIQSDEENRLMNQIHGLEMAQENLTAYLETGKGSDTILNKLQQNETTLKTLQQQLVYKKIEIPTVDEDTYHRLVKQFKHYMSHIKSPEASALKAAAIQDIEIQKEDITVRACVHRRFKSVAA